MMLHSGDIVIMSDESRLAFHGVPKVLPPSTQSEVPDCLSSAALDQIVQQQKGPGHGDHTCCICAADLTSGQLRPGVVAVATEECTRERYLKTDHTTLSAEPTHKRIDRVDCTGTDSCRSTAESCTNSGVRLDDVHHGTNVCLSCQQIIADWPQFEQYLSVSRINVNVRQVVSEKCKFWKT